MKTNKIVYYISTGIISIMMIYSSIVYLTQEELVATFRHLGFPDYFRIELAIAKFISAVLLWIPANRNIREWAYAGFGLNFISAFIAHLSVGDSVSLFVFPLVFLFILSVSYISYHNILKSKV